MKLLHRLAAACTATATLGLLGAATASASPAPRSSYHSGSHAVFVETDNPAGNQVVSYVRQRGGSLALKGAYQTGGLGGVLNGSVADHQASQGALDYVSSRRLLLATNAGSNTISVFSVYGSRLQLRQIINSGGLFPVSIADSGNTVYVLNARNGGSVEGFRIDGDHLDAIPGSTVPLGFTPVTDDNEFTHTPGQISFSPDGRQVLVTTKALGQSVEVWAVRPDGRLAGNPTVNAVNNVPFAVAFTSADQLLLVEAAGDVASFRLDARGALRPVASVPTNQAASCWIAQAGPYWYVSNAGSSTLSGIAANRSGALTVLGTTPTDAGTIDAAASPSGRYLYVRAGINGTLSTFRVQPDGSLAAVGAPITVAGAAGGEGIAVS